jgi:hypothetical protein
MRNARLLCGLLMIGSMSLTTCSKPSSPQSTVKAFLAAVNSGKTESAKAYWSDGYSDMDKERLEKNFPAGSIKGVTFDDVSIVGENASLRMTVKLAKNHPWGYSGWDARLTLVKKADGWKINREGGDWFFN